MGALPATGSAAGATGESFLMEIKILFLLVDLSQIILHSFLSHPVNLQNVFKSCKPCDVLLSSEPWNSEEMTS